MFSGSVFMGTTPRSLELHIDRAKYWEDLSPSCCKLVQSARCTTATAFAKLFVRELSCIPQELTLGVLFALSKWWYAKHQLPRQNGIMRALTSRRRGTTARGSLHIDHRGTVVTVWSGRCPRS
jgi:hypothetical protein